MKILVDKKIKGLFEELDWGALEAPAASSMLSRHTAQVVIENNEKDNYIIPDTVESKELDNGDLVIDVPGEYYFNRYENKFTRIDEEKIKDFIDTLRK